MAVEIGRIREWAESLTTAERLKISEVLERDLSLQRQENDRVGSLETDLRRIRSQTALKVDSAIRQCGRCNRKLGLLFSPGEQCPQCKHMICTDCQRTFISTNKRKWLCSLCYATREYKAQSGAWLSQKNDADFGNVVLGLSETILDEFQKATKMAELQAERNAKDSLHNSGKKAPKLAEVVRRFCPPMRSVSSLYSKHHGKHQPQLSQNTAVVTRAPSAPDFQMNEKQTHDDSLLVLPSTGNLTKATSMGCLTQTNSKGVQKAEVLQKTLTESDRSSSVPVLPQIFLTRDASNASDLSNSSNTSSKSTRSHFVEPSMRSVSLLSFSTIGSRNLQVQGEILLRLVYNYRAGALEVHVAECRGLVQIGKSKPNPYVKTYLLPDRSQASKRKTRTRRSTVNPRFLEMIRYGGMTKFELEQRTLLISVWHKDYFGRNSFLGEIRIQMDEYPWTGDVGKQYWYTLEPKQEDPPPDPLQSLLTECRLSLSVKFTPPDLTEQQTTGSLHCLLLSASGLQIDTASRPKATLFIKARMFQENKVVKLKSPLVPYDNPLWNHTFVFIGQTMVELANRRLELRLWEQRGRTTKHLLGHICLSLPEACTNEPIRPTVDEMNIWQQVVCNPNTWAEATLPLQRSLTESK